MSDFLGLFGDDKSQNTESENSQTTMSNQGNDPSTSTQDTKTDGSLQLHKEELDIVKNNVDAGQVVISKDVVEEQRTVDVPVIHEEVVIKRTPLNNERSDGSTLSQETITIPVTQEQVEVNKYTVATEEISASKRQIEDTQKVQETLRHEEAHVDTTGGVDIVSDGSSFNDINNS